MSRKLFLRELRGQVSAYEPPLLFDPGTDPGESFNVAASHPEILAEIAKAVERHQASVIPAPNQLDAAMPEEAVPLGK